MEHQDALREMYVEKYLLGELAGPQREQFEEHLFDCELCAADLKAGVKFLNAAQSELAQQARQTVTAAPATPQRRRLLSPAWLAPALAASLVAIAYQSLVLVPHMHQQLAQAEAPGILSDVMLTGGSSRGAGTIPHVSAPVHGSFLLSVDIPTQPVYRSYLCSLYAPGGRLAWRGTIASSSAQDTVQIHVPADVTTAGTNTLAIEGSRAHPGAAGAKLESLASRQFVLELGN